MILRVITTKGIVILRVITTEGILDLDVTDPEEIAMAYGHASAVKETLREQNPDRSCPVCRESFTKDDAALLAKTDPSALILVHEKCITAALNHRPEYKRIDAPRG